jgi:hypothetical protein
MKAAPEGVAMIDFSGDPWSWPALAELDEEQIHDLFLNGGDPKLLQNASCRRIP